MAQQLSQREVSLHPGESIRYVITEAHARAEEFGEWKDSRRRIEWPFSQCFFRVNQAEVRSQQALKACGLAEQFAVLPANQPTGYLLFAN